jgi:1,4-alpha-glucan branching enzyme
MDRPPIIISPYDAELYGHWWFEGPCSSATCSASCTTIRASSDDHAGAVPRPPPDQQVATPSASS